MPQSHSQELIPGVTNPDYEANGFSNAEIDITYTDNPTYESLSGSGMLQESPLDAQYIVPVQAKRNEGCPGSNITRNVDALHACLDGSKQNSFILPITDIGDNLNTQQDTAKYLGTLTCVPDHRNEVDMHDEPFEATAICRQPAQSCQCNNQITTQAAATRNVPMHVTKPSFPSHKMYVEKYPCETDV